MKVRASRNRNGTEQALFALISRRPGHRLSRVFRRPSALRTAPPPPEGGVRAQCAAIGPTPARVTPRSKTHLRVERAEKAQSSVAQSCLRPTLPFGGRMRGLQHRRQAQSRNQPLGRIPEKARSDLPSLARVGLHSQPNSPCGASGQAQRRDGGHDGPLPVQICLPVSVSRARECSKHGTGQAGASRRF